MNAVPTSLPGVLLLEPRVLEDARGCFYESYRTDTFRALGISCAFVQENHSTSTRGVLRGLHYQRRRSQDKVIRVVQGEIFDVALDLRRGSPTFGKWTGDLLSSANRRQLFIPAGFAHGFITLSPTADVVYRCSDFHAPDEERGVLWNDPALGIAWPSVGGPPVLSPRDAGLPVLSAVPPSDLPGAI